MTQIFVHYTLACFLSLILTSKATVFGMVSIALLFYFYKLLKVYGIKKLVIPVLVLLIFIIGLSVENYSANQKLLFQYEDLNEKLYNNPAELSLFYEVNFYDLFFHHLDTTTQTL